MFSLLSTQEHLSKFLELVGWLVQEDLVQDLILER
jgi:hypothetical protein